MSTIKDLFFMVDVTNQDQLAFGSVFIQTESDDVTDEIHLQLLRDIEWSFQFSEKTHLTHRLYKYKPKFHKTLIAHKVDIVNNFKLEAQNDLFELMAEYKLNFSTPTIASVVEKFKLFCQENEKNKDDTYVAHSESPMFIDAVRVSLDLSNNFRQIECTYYVQIYKQGKHVKMMFSSPDILIKIRY